MAYLSQSELTHSDENFPTVKEWLFSKLQIPYTESASAEDREFSENAQSGRLPTIVISQGSNRSIDHLVSSPVISVASRLSQSYSDTTKHSLYQIKDTESFKSTCNTRLYRQRPVSEPSTPNQHSKKSANRNGSINRLMSQVFRYTKHPNENNHSSLQYTQSCSSISKEIEQCMDEKSSETKALEKDTNRRELSLNEPSTLQSRKLTLDSSNSNIAIRRTSSCGASSNSDRKKQSTIISKAVSQKDIVNRTNKKSPFGKLRKAKRTFSKDKTKSLTRSSSTNLDWLRGQLHTTCDRKLSLANTSELQQTYERRRSSVLRLLGCHQTSEELNEQLDDSNSIGSPNEKNISNFSPKVTRPLYIGSLHKLGTQVDSFKSTFESDMRNIPSSYGQVKMMFQYMTTKKQLSVILLRGCNIGSTYTGDLGLFAQLCLMPGKRQKQKTFNKHSTRDPSMFESFRFRLSLDEVLESQLRVKFYSKPTAFSLSRPIGECSIELYCHDLTASTVIWKNLCKSKGQKDEQDEFDFTLINNSNEQPQKKGIGRIFTACTRR